MYNSMNKHVIGPGIAVKVNYYKIFESGMFSINFLLLFCASHCYFIAVHCISEVFDLLFLYLNHLTYYLPNFHCEEECLNEVHN